MRRAYIVTPLVFLLVLTSCTEDSVTEPEQLPPQGNTVTARNIPADTGNVGHFTFFRLRDSSLVALADSNSLSWDIAFRTTTIIVNSGSSGPGHAGAIVLRNTEFDTMSIVPASGYQVDTSLTQRAIPTGSGNGWYNYNFATNIITPIPGVVLAIKTVDGKYAKLEILSYYLNAPSVPTATDTPRFYTFRYFYQSDGSTSVR